MNPLLEVAEVFFTYHNRCFSASLLTLQRQTHAQIFYWNQHIDWKRFQGKVRRLKRTTKALYKYYAGLIFFLWFRKKILASGLPSDSSKKKSRAHSPVTYLIFFWAMTDMVCKLFSSSFVFSMFTQCSHLLSATYRQETLRLINLKSRWCWQASSMNRIVKDHRRSSTGFVPFLYDAHLKVASFESYGLLYNPFRRHQVPMRRDVWQCVQNIHNFL